MTPKLILRICLLLSLLGLSGCQSFSERKVQLNSVQIAALKQEGFVKSEEGWEFSASEKLLFGSNEATLLPSAFEAVQRIAKLLIKIDINTVRIDGHTDTTGSATHNQQLSLRRAQVVADAMTKGGIPIDGIRIRGLGSRVPVVSNQTPDGRAQNRRVVLVIASE